MPEGVVKWFSAEKGMDSSPRTTGQGPVRAFLRDPGSGYRNLEEGQRVSFEATEGQKGPQASSVSPL